MKAAVLVAHPDDETIWAGGTILSHPDWDWFIATLCRAGDPDRAPRFRQVLALLNARGEMADLDDGPEQAPLPADLVQKTILTLLPTTEYDLILTHSPRGEYTRHLRHEETGRALLDLWDRNIVRAGRMTLFAYTDRQRATLPQACDDADLRTELDLETWQRKYRLVTQVYGFSPQSWEARTTPRIEAFWLLDTPGDLYRLEKQEDTPS